MERMGASRVKAGTELVVWDDGGSTKRFGMRKFAQIRRADEVGSG